jgi:hypothetical protein
MNHFKKLALATALAVCAATGAQAAEEDSVFLLTNATEGVPGVFSGTYSMDSLQFGSPSDGQQLLFTNVSTRVSGDTFYDDYLLEINDSQEVSFYVAANGVKSGKKVVPGVVFSGFTLSDLTFSTFYTPGSDSDVEANSLFGDWTLSTGVYDLEISGKINANGGGYAGELDTVPVPEPTGWAMLMAGLGAIGMLARRRKTQA